MNTFIAMTQERQRLLCEQVAGRTGLFDSSVEKDFWVAWTLRELFALPEWGTYLTFKGGTSLSKGWKLLERFSEDIDIVIDRAPLGFEGADAPDRAPSNKQKRKRLEALKAASQRCVREHIHPLLQDAVGRVLSDGLQWSLDSDL